MTGSIEESIEIMVQRLFMNIMITSFIMTIIYNAIDGSTLLMFVYHWLMNIAYPWEAKAGISIAQDLIDIILLSVLVILFYRTYIQSENLYTDVLPGIEMAQN